MDALRFQRSPIRPWTGRYRRIPGDTSVLHVTWVDGTSRVALLWDVDGSRGTCVAVDEPAVRSLAAAVVEAKQSMGGNQGGAFLVNEFGQILVPASDGGERRVLAGELAGSLRYEDPFADRTFTLGDDAGLSPGDAWLFPYVGIPFNLSGRSKVYFWREDEERGHAEYPRREDPNLVKSLRSIRRSGALRFIVNPERVVLTKRPPQGEWGGPNETWKPVYVGRLNLQAWFDKEK